MQTDNKFIFHGQMNKQFFSQKQNTENTERLLIKRRGDFGQHDWLTNKKKMMEYKTNEEDELFINEFITENMFKSLPFCGGADNLYCSKMHQDFSKNGVYPNISNKHSNNGPQLGTDRENPKKKNKKKNRKRKGYMGRSDIEYGTEITEFSTYE